MINISFDKILFIDIETVPMVADFCDLSVEMQELWEEKFSRLQKNIPQKYAELSSAEGFKDSAGIYAEFGKIVCISVGFCHSRQGERCFRARSFAGDDERQILVDFFDLVARFFSSPNHTFCGHNIKEFDIPYICRRALIQGLKLPDMIRISGKKPWEVNFIDTLDLWKFGDYKNYTSLKTLTAVFGIPTPKDDINGSEVAGVYYGEHDIRRIATYCQKDVVATAQVLFRLCGEDTIKPENIEHILY